MEEKEQPLKERTLDDFLPASKKKKNKLRRSAFIVGITLLALAAVWFAVLQSGFDAALVRQQLDMLAAQLREDGKQQGRFVQLTYGDVEMRGTLGSRHAAIHDVQLLMKPERGKPGTPERPNSLLISTPLLELHSSTLGSAALTFAFPQPVNVASEEAPAKIMLQVTANAPVALEVEQKQMHGAMYTRWRQALPTEVRVTYLKEKQAAGEEDETPTVVPIYRTLIVTSDRAEADISVAQDESGHGEAVLVLDNVAIMPEDLPEGTIRVGEVRGYWKNLLDNDQQKDMEGRLKINAVTAAPEIISYAPVTFDINVSQHGQMPRPGQPVFEPASYQLKTFRLHTKDATIDANADFSTHEGDLLPAGKASLNMKNVPFILAELKRLRLLGEENDAMLADIIARVAGQPFEQVQDLNVAIDREKGGAFTIGKSTFEELFTLVLSHKIQQYTAGQGDVVVPPEKRQPVILMDEHGDRG